MTPSTVLHEAGNCATIMRQVSRTLREELPSVRTTHLLGYRIASLCDSFDETSADVERLVTELEHRADCDSERNEKRLIAWLRAEILSLVDLVHELEKAKQRDERFASGHLIAAAATGQILPAFDKAYRALALNRTVPLLTPVEQLQPEPERLPSLALTPRFTRALEIASHMHRSQARRSSRVPYVSHLLAVASLVLEYGGDEDMAIAGLLHDLIEDQSGGPPQADALRHDLNVEFGQRVVSIISACSDVEYSDSKGPWHERKQRLINRLRSVPWEVIVVFGAETLHNLRSLLSEYRAPYADTTSLSNFVRGDRAWYAQEVANALAHADKGKRAQGLIEEIYWNVRELGKRVNFDDDCERYDPANWKAEATEATDRVATEIIAWLKSMPATLSGDDTPLRNVWEELCVQLQVDESFYWAAYEETIRLDIHARVEALATVTRMAIWLQTDEGSDWFSDLDYDKRHSENFPPSFLDENIDSVIYEIICQRAYDYQSEGIDKFEESIYGSDEADDCDDEPVDDSTTHAEDEECDVESLKEQTATPGQDRDDGPARNAGLGVSQGELDFVKIALPSDQSYDVLVIDNGHVPDEGASHLVGGFASWEAAVEYARRRTRDSVEEFRRQDQAAEQLRAEFLHFGESCSVNGMDDRHYRARDELDYFVANPATDEQRDWGSIGPKRK